MPCWTGRRPVLHVADDRPKADTGRVADLERHMVEADRTRFSVFGHGALQHVALNRGKPLLLLRGSVVFSLNTVGRGSIKKRLHLFRDHVGKFLLHRKLAMRQLDGLDARDGYERLHLCF